jgi:hypothetical protein
VIDPRLCHRRVDNHALAGGEIAGNHFGPRQLLCDERGNIRLESAGTNAHNDQSNQETGKGVIRVDDDWRNGRDSQNDMANNGNCKRPANRPIPSEVGICNVRAKERHKVDPKLIEGSNTSRSSLLEIQGTGLAIMACSRARSKGKRLLDEICD